MKLQIEKDKITIYPEAEHEYKQLVKILQSIMYLLKGKEEKE